VVAILISPLIQSAVSAQTTYTWQEVKDKFEAVNPTLNAARLNMDESRAAEITAYLRPNPILSFSTDGTQLTPFKGSWLPFAGTQKSPGVSYLHERQGKRELRRDSAREATAISELTYSDQERTLLFNLRNAFVQVLQAKAALQNTQDNLSYWDRELDLNRRRLNAGDIAQIDLNRMELQRVQFESDFETATVNLRTSKIQLLTLLNDRTPIEQFDVIGTYDFNDLMMPLDEYRGVALSTRPDLKSASKSVELAKVNHKLAIANGSSDPTFNLWWTRNPSFNNPFDLNTIGGSVTIPLRVFDKNQGEKERTRIEIGRSEQLRDAAEASVLSDVDSAYWTLIQALNLLKPYKAKYLPLAAENRTRVSVAYQNGGASLLDFLDAEKAYRDTRLAYLNLIGSFLTAAAQLNMAVGMEVVR
jgi:cobalt-zinc-cadmium efflux system outer membrane protein